MNDKTMPVGTYLTNHRPLPKNERRTCNGRHMVNLCVVLPTARAFNCYVAPATFLEEAARIVQATDAVAVSAFHGGESMVALGIEVRS